MCAAEIVDGPLAQLHLLGRVGAAKEVAERVAFPASDASSFTTGATHPVDGGLSAGFAVAPAGGEDGAGNSAIQALGEQK